MIGQRIWQVILSVVARIGQNRVVEAEIGGMATSLLHWCRRRDGRLALKRFG
jgi:hypothetical protein